MKPRKPFPWPDGKRAAVSLSFDDARFSQLDVGMPVLDEYGVRATFYVTLRTMRKRLPDWRKAIATGHEIGNHTVLHPCTINFPWAKPKRALENYTLAQMDWELTEANAMIEKLVGIEAKTFAYPCGQKFVGRGRQLKSYVPLVAKHFLAGRGFRDEMLTDPRVCDLAQVCGTDFDCLTFPEMKAYVDTAREQGTWLVFVGHNVGQPARQTVRRDALQRLCRYLTNPANDLWVAPVQDVARLVKRHAGSAK